MSQKFALIGTAGFVAPRHLRAIKEVGGELVAAFDPHDAVGLLDNFFPEAASFTEFERFDRHLEKRKRAGEKLAFLTVCSPNYLHDAHIRFGLKNGLDVICEKPLVINPWNLAPLAELESETGRRVWAILQLRHHPEILSLKEKVGTGEKQTPHEVELTYITPRGPWYHASWKGDEAKSGGILTNIGIHLFDALTWVFGEATEVEIHQKSQSRASGFLKLERANVRWFLSIEREALPENVNGAPLRILTCDHEEVDFSGGFTDLHTESYRAILDGRGWSISDAGRAVSLSHRLRGEAVSIEPLTELLQKKRAHPFCEKPAQPHPFSPK